MQPDLTDFQIITQSVACHPDWDAETHLGYLKYEEDREVTLVQVKSWLVLLALSEPLDPPTEMPQ